MILHYIYFFRKFASPYDTHSCAPPPKSGALRFFQAGYGPASRSKHSLTKSAGTGTNYLGNKISWPDDDDRDGEGAREWSKAGWFWDDGDSETPARFLIPRWAIAPGAFQVEESASAASSSFASCCSCITHSSIIFSTRASFSASRNSRTLSALPGCFKRKCFRRLHWQGSEYSQNAHLCRNTKQQFNTI